MFLSGGKEQPLIAGYIEGCFYTRGSIGHSGILVECVFKCNKYPFGHKNYK